jgi:hypothetical protein
MRVFIQTLIRLHGADTTWSRAEAKQRLYWARDQLHTAGKLSLPPDRSSHFGGLAFNVSSK